MTNKQFQDAVRKLLTVKPESQALLAASRCSPAASNDLVTRVAKAIWEAHGEEESDCPPWDKLWESEQEEWRQSARAAIVETLKPQENAGDEP